MGALTLEISPNENRNTDMIDYTNDQHFACNHRGEAVETVINLETGKPFELSRISTPYEAYPRTWSAQLRTAAQLGCEVFTNPTALETTDDPELTEYSPRHVSDNRPWVGTDTGARYGSYGLRPVPTLESLQRGYIGYGGRLEYHLTVTYAFGLCGTRLWTCSDRPQLHHRDEETGGRGRRAAGLCRYCYKSEVIGMSRLTDEQRATVPYIPVDLEEEMWNVDTRGEWHDRGDGVMELGSVPPLVPMPDEARPYRSPNSYCS